MQSVADMALYGIEGCSFESYPNPAGSAALTPWPRRSIFPRLREEDSWV